MYIIERSWKMEKLRMSPDGLVEAKDTDMKILWTTEKE
jgi:hypothetical protein